MRHAGLEKKLSDSEYERRFTRGFAQHFLMLLPLLTYIGVTYWELRYLSPLAVVMTAASYGVVLIIVALQTRRATLAAMRREGLVDGDFRPPGD